MLRAVLNSKKRCSARKLSEKVFGVLKSKQRFGCIESARA